MVKVISAGRYVEVKSLHYLELERRIRGQPGRHTKSRDPAGVRVTTPPAKVRPRSLTAERAKLAALLAPLGDEPSATLN